MEGGESAAMTSYANRDSLAGLTDTLKRIDNEILKLKKS